LLTLSLLAASVAAGVWWLGYIPYDPLAIYRPIPASATLVGRHLQLPARWSDLLANPLALALMRTAGVQTEAAAGWVGDEESRAWFEKLAGREGTLAYLPGRFGGGPAWMAVSYLGGESQKLRWQLSLFKLPGFTRMKQFPGRSVWRVDSPDLEPGQSLAIAFGEGVIMACLAESPLAIAEVLAAYDGSVRRLMEEESAFKRFAEEDGRTVLDRLWFRDESEFAADDVPGVAVEIPVLRGDAISLMATMAGAEIIPEDRGSAVDLGPLARRLGDTPCLAALVRRDALLQVWPRPDLTSNARHVLRMILDVATAESIAVVAMDGEMGGRLTLGWMSMLGAGLRVSTLMVATPVPSEAFAMEAIQRVLDASNARYRATFVLKPMTLPAATLHVLESAGGNEWVDKLPLLDRPAYTVLDGWLFASSNLGALQKLAQSEAQGMPNWAAQLDGSKAVSIWLSLERSRQEARNAIATLSMVQRAQGFLKSGNSREILAQLNEAKAWLDASSNLAGVARAQLGRREGQTVLALDLGLSPAVGSDRIPAP
jgi:hypothetical protein